jgi:outer membrane protein assembly factor BamB
MLRVKPRSRWGAHGLLLAFVLPGAGLASCGRNDLREVTACVPLSSVACECATGLGVQYCHADGSHFSSCSCEDAPPTAGTHDGSSTGGARPVGSTGGAGNVSSGATGAGNRGGSSGGPTSQACPAELVACGAVCVHLGDNAKNCGSCGHVCGTGESCVNGACQASCAPKQSRCGDVCANLATDASHCGSCGTDCALDEVCSAGVCECDAAFTRCGSACVDVTSHDAHCGACGNVCAKGKACTFGACGADGAGWPTLGFDMQRLGVNTEETGVPPLTRAWAKSMATSALNPVVVERGRVIVSGSPRFEEDGPIYAVSAADGRVLWTHDFGEVSSLGHATLFGGHVYVQHGKGIHTPDHAALHVLDAVSGRHLWEAKIGAQWEHYWAPAVTEDSVYVNGGGYGGLYGFVRSNGVLKFFFDGLEQYDEWSPVIAAGDVVTMVMGHLRVHNPKTGTVLTTIAMPWDGRAARSQGTVPVRDGIAYAVVPPSIRAYELAGKFLQWERTSEYGSYPAVSETHVYTLDGGSLAALDRASGEEVWRFAGDGELFYAPVVAAGHVYVSSRSHVYVVDALSGSEVGQDDVGGWLTVAARRLFVARSDGVLSVYNLSNPP